MSINQYYNILSDEEINYLLQTSEVINAKKNIDSKENGAVYFSISLNNNKNNNNKHFEKLNNIKNKLSIHFNLNLDQIDSIPMRWIKGDTKPHIDKEANANLFKNTYLMYLTNSNGSLIIEDSSYPITQGCAYIFSEGLYHETKNTGSTPRLLIGPMSENMIAVGSLPPVKTVISRRVLHENTNYTDYRITYYSDNSAMVQIYQKNGTTNCYQLVGTVNVPYCVPN